MPPSPDVTVADIHRTLVERAEAGLPFALLVVLSVEGSTPGHPGAKAIVDPLGAIQGTIGGGPVEAEAQRRAAEAIRSGRPEVFDVDLQGRSVGEADPICGGKMRLLVDPTAARHRAAYAQAWALQQHRRRGLLLTTLRCHPDCEVTVQCCPEPLPADAAFPGVETMRRVLERETAESFVVSRSRGGEVLVEPLAPRPRLLIVGGGHVGQAVAAHADLVGFDVVVLDDRPEFTAPQLFPPMAQTHCGPVREQLAAFPFSSDTYVVIVTRGHQHDAEALAVCLRQPTAYLGMIGSRRKVALMRRDFLQSGQATPAEFERVYAPIGLDIGAVSVPEIAASIVAQLIAVRRRGSAPRIPIPDLG